MFQSHLICNSQRQCMPSSANSTAFMRRAYAESTWCNVFTPGMAATPEASDRNCTNRISAEKNDWYKKALTEKGMAIHRPHAKLKQDLKQVGDIMLANVIARNMAEEGVDQPFELVAPYLQQADITFGNLEGTLTERIAGSRCSKGSASSRAS